MLYDETIPSMKQNSLEFLKSSYELVYSIESLILRVWKLFLFENILNFEKKEHAYNRGNHESDYLSAFDQIKSISPCPIIIDDGQVTLEECAYFYHGIVNEVEIFCNFSQKKKINFRACRVLLPIISNMSIICWGSMKTSSKTPRKA